jgi:GNAT superfamily N-acetyltransferase
MTFHFTLSALGAEHVAALRPLEEACLSAAPHMLGDASAASALRNHAREWHDFAQQLLGRMQVCPGHLALVGLWQGPQLVGYAYAAAGEGGLNGVSKHRYPWWLKCLMVHPTCQGHGGGKLLVQHVIQQLAAQRVPGLALKVYDTQTPALLLYHNLGFETLKTERNRHFGWHYLGLNLTATARKLVAA